MESITLEQIISVIQKTNKREVQKYIEAKILEGIQLSKNLDEKSFYQNDKKINIAKQLLVIVDDWENLEEVYSQIKKSGFENNEDNELERKAQRAADADEYLRRWSK